MLSRQEAAQAKKWRSDGWPIAAIARQLQRSPNTIKTYLTGRRLPGPRTARADTFAPFADYSRQRLADDPHLNTKALFGELAELGYPGSYKSFCRAVQRHRLRGDCQPCRTPQATAPNTARPHPPTRRPAPLPMPVPPVTGETLISYLGRVAAANHIAITDLLTILPPWFHTKINNHDDRGRHHLLAPATTDALHQLALLTTATPTALAHALPAFDHGDPRAPVRATTACRRCMATRGITHPIPVHLPAHQQICTRHSLWLPAGDRAQLDIAACPEIITAQHRACKLLRARTPQQLIFAHVAASQLINEQRRNTSPAARSQQQQQRLRLLEHNNRHLSDPAAQDDLLHAAIYPEAVALTAITLPGHT
jgi:TniQ